MANKKFVYRALDQNKNKIVKGTMQLPNERALEQTLADSNLTLISSKEVRSSINLSFLEKITDKDLIIFFTNLEQLENAGVPLLDSLSDLKEFSTNQKIKDISADIYENVKGGKLLSEAMEKHKKVFDNVAISLVAMGEKTGNLHTAFKNITENIKWSSAIKRKTVKAIRYPLFSLGVMFAVAAIMLKVVVPKVMGFILDQGIDVPTYTIALMKTSQFFQDWFITFIASGIGAFILIKIASRNKSIKYQVDRVKLKLPAIGEVIVKIEMSKFTKFFAVTFSSGIPILECLTISGNVVNNTVLKTEVARIRQDVSDGKSIYNAMATSPYFPSIVLRMFKIGEDSGNMVEAMANVEYFYTTEIDDAIDKLIGTLQPMIMFVMGGLMAWVIAGVFGPIYGNFDNFGA